MEQQTSLLVERQLPGFVREDHPKFVQFLQAYYKFLESPTNEYKEIKYITDVDLSFERYKDQYFDAFANLLPREFKVNGSFLIKNVLPLYLSKGSERSFRYLFRALYDEEIEVRYLRNNILYTSSSKWVQENSLNISAIISSKYISDGSNTSFYLIDFVSEQDIEVYFDGVLFTGDYGVSKTYRKLIFDLAPPEDTVIEVRYKVINKDIFLSRKVRGVKSNATCIVEKTSFELINNRQTIKLFVNSKTVNGKFLIGEKLYTNVFINNTLVDVELKSISELKAINVIDGGANYNVGDPALIIAPGADRNPVAVVRRVFLPVIESIRILDGGCGFTPGYNVTVNGLDFPIANVKIASTLIEPYTKNTANTFVVYSDVISDIDPANTLISAPSYGLSRETGNITSNIYSCFSEVQYANIGEIIAVEVGDIFIPFYEKPVLKALPTQIEIQNIGFTVANTKVSIASYGSLGKITISNRGTNYKIGDEIEFTNKPGNLGLGAAAEVSEITTQGEILSIDFVPFKISGTANVNILTSNIFVQGTGTLFTSELKVGDRIMINQESKVISDISSDTTLNVTTGFSQSFINKPVRFYGKYAVGGQGYSQNKLPDAVVVSTTGSGAQITVSAIMGSGDNIDANTTPLNGRKIGAIQEFQILDAGEGFTTIPLIDMTNYGSGNAKAEAVLYPTYETYDGRWISTDSHLSSLDRKLQGLDYYINYSYVISSRVQFNKYKNVVKELVHPAGYINYAEYQLKNTIFTDIVTVESNTAIDFSANVESVSFNVYVGNTTTISTTSTDDFAVNANNYYINQLPSFNNLNVVFASTIVISNSEITKFNVFVPLTSIVSNNSVITFNTFATEPPSILSNENVSTFNVNVNVTITSAEIFANVNNVFTYPINVSTSKILYSSNTNQFVTVRLNNHSILSTSNSNQFIANISLDESIYNLSGSETLNTFIDSLQGEQSVIVGTNNNVIIE